MATPTNSVRGVAVVLVVALVASAGATAAVDTNSSSTPMTKLSSCGTIDTPGKYIITEDIEDAPADGCFAVEANHVSIYGHGHTVATEDGTGAAIEATNVQRVFVSNIDASGWETGVAFKNVDRGVVTGIEFQNSSGVAVSLLDGTSDVSVDRNVVTDGVNGVRVDVVDEGNVVKQNEFTNLTGVAVSVSNSDPVTVAGNDVNGSALGIDVEDSPGMTVRNNVVWNTDGPSIRIDNDASAAVASSMVATRTEQRYLEALQFFESDVDTDTVESRVANNTIGGTSARGLIVNRTASATIADNVVTDTKDGVYIHDSTDVSVTNNQIRTSADDGVALAATSNTTVADNNVTTSGDDGIYVVGSDNVVSNNTATKNGDDGVDLQNASRATVSGNVFVENGNDGVYLRDTDNATIEANQIRANGDAGLDFRSSSWNVVRNNEVCGNDDNKVAQRHGASNNEFEKNGC